MIVKNKLERTFGPFGSSTGFFLFLGGLLATYYSLTGLIIVFIGAFVTFTSTSAIIDTSKKRIKHSSNLFGIIPCGKWVHIQPGMKLGLGKSHKGYRAYIMGTQPIGIHVNDIRIYLYGTDNKKIMPLQKFDNYSSAKAGLDDMSSVLLLDTLS